MAARNGPPRDRPAVAGDVRARDGGGFGGLGLGVDEDVVDLTSGRAGAGAGSSAGEAMGLSGGFGPGQPTLAGPGDVLADFQRALNQGNPNVTEQILASQPDLLAVLSEAKLSGIPARHPALGTVDPGLAASLIARAESVLRRPLTTPPLQQHGHQPMQHGAPFHSVAPGAPSARFPGGGGGFQQQPQGFGWQQGAPPHVQPQQQPSPQQLHPQAVPPPQQPAWQGTGAPGMGALGQQPATSTAGAGWGGPLPDAVNSRRSRWGPK